MEEVFNILHDFRSQHPDLFIEILFTVDWVQVTVGKGVTGMRQQRRYTHEALITKNDYIQVFRRELVEMAEFIGG